jgi:hypothetical protein
MTCVLTTALSLILFFTAACNYKDDARILDLVNMVEFNQTTSMETAEVLGDVWYLIETEAHLRSIGSEKYPLSAKYMLSADITLSKTEDWKPLGTFGAPFTGAFNGNGYEIINLTIKDASVKAIGMFAYVQNAHIGNVTLRNPDIESAFRAGSSIAPIVVFGLGKSNNIYGNQLVHDTNEKH